MSYITEDFLLHSDAARELYHNYAEAMPIIDYHCHLPPAEVAEDRRWDNLATLWLGGDHYKWRALRSNGVDENLITGSASPREKFQAFAESMPYFLRNPLYDWSHLELLRYFGISETLSPATADAIWEKTSEMLSREDFSARSFMRRSNVRVVCTTDDPADDLRHHRAVRESGFEVKMLPAWRPDKTMNVDRPDTWNAYISKLEAASGRDIVTFADLIEALRMRHDFFAAEGCRLSDYGIDTVPDVALPTEKEMAAIFAKARSGIAASPDEAASFRFGMLVEFGRMDAASDWTWQLHYGAVRNNSTRIFKLLGPDSGADSIDDQPVARGMARLLDILDRDDLLPRTVIYTLNPRDNALVGTMIGNFQRGPVAGKLQFGSGWWFNDNKDGMRAQIDSLSNLGLISRFVGMLTDSRSFLSYPRHEYFRRILCDIFGSEIEAGDIPRDIEWTGKIIQDICYNNAARYFGF